MRDAPLIMMNASARSVGVDECSSSVAPAQQAHMQACTAILPRPWTWRLPTLHTGPYRLFKRPRPAIAKSAKSAIGRVIKKESGRCDLRTALMHVKAGGRAQPAVGQTGRDRRHETGLVGAGWLSCQRAVSDSPSTAVELDMGVARHTSVLVTCKASRSCFRRTREI